MEGEGEQNQGSGSNQVAMMPKRIGEVASVCKNSWMNSQRFARTLLILKSNVPLSLEP